MSSTLLGLILFIIHVCIGIEPWTFIQKVGDAVFIPAGCPHQVRNLKVDVFFQLLLCRDLVKAFY